MSRLIDADALLEGREDHEMISTHLIWNAPTIEAEPVRHGRWIERYGVYEGKYYKCSACDYNCSHTKENYCSYCGAKMDGGKSDDV